MRPLGGALSSLPRPCLFRRGRARRPLHGARRGDRAHRRRWRRRADGRGRPLAVLGRLAPRHPPASTRG